MVLPRFPLLAAFAVCASAQSPYADVRGEPDGEHIVFKP